MLRTHTANELKPGKDVKIAGWVHETRSLGSIVFLIIRDGTGLIQVTAKKGVVSEKLLDEINKLKKESVVVIEGDAVANKNAPGGVEIIPKELKVIAEVKEVLPIDMSKNIKSTLDKRLDFRCLDLRKEENQAVFKVQSTLIQEIQSFLDSKGFYQVFTPCIMGVASESGSDVFTILYYDKEAFLRQDPQLHRQLTIAGGFEKIYDVGPSWRAEPSHTTRHLCEHRTCAAEMAFIEDEYDIIRLEEEMIKFAMKKLMKDCKDELKMFDVKIEIPDKFPVLEFPEVYDILDKLGEHPVREKESYGSEGEKILGEYVKKKYHSDFFFVNHFPFAEKPFYVMRVEGTPWARSIDLVFKGMEMSSGGQREHRYDKIMEQAKIKKMSPDSVKWFADFFKYGVPPHGGFALGLERLTKQILGLQNVREAVLFPRDPERLTP